MEVSMSAFRSPSTMESASSSDSLFRTVLGRLLGPGTGMRRFDARQGHTLGFKRTVPWCRFHGYTALLYLQVKVYANKQIPLAFWLIGSFSSPDLNTCHFSPDGFNVCVVGFYRG